MTAYSQGHAPSVLASQQWRTVANSAAYVADRFTPGTTVLDVGCGTGTITLDIARRVAPGRVLGVDVEPSVIATAREAAAGVAGVEFVVGDVGDLPAVTGGERFDVVHAHQVLLHLTDPVAALRAMLAVSRGVVAARDSDYGGIVHHPHDPRLDRWLDIYHRVARAHGTEPDAGRRLLSWAHAAGARDVTPSASIWSFATDAERRWWGGQWAERIVDSTIAERAVAGGIATADELREIAAAWTDWSRNPDGWFAIPHGEIVASSGA
ncbi:methyltransferase domain-containing protein [Actinomycetospora sp. C-140]